MSRLNHSPPADPIEVEQKFRLPDPAALLSALQRHGAIEQGIEQHADTYYGHPCRDFQQTREALRIRRVVRHRRGDGAAEPSSTETYVTYKGAYLAQLHVSGIKARAEIQWRIDADDPGGRHFATLLDRLGFVEAMTVRKTRQSFQLQRADRTFTVTIDDAQRLGQFAEVETLAAGTPDAEASRGGLQQLANELGLHQLEPRSYLAMALQAVGRNSRA